MHDYPGSLRKARTKEPEVYTTAHDTGLLRLAVKRYRGRRALEIGFGNGSVLQELARRFEVVAGTEVVLPREVAASVGAEGAIVVADRASCFRDLTFDLVAFNPPYLPSAEIEDVAVDGGQGGIEVPLLFLEDAVRVLTRVGSILLVLSSESDVSGFEAGCMARGLRAKVIAQRDLFYEVLYIFEVKREDE